MKVVKYILDLITVLILNECVNGTSLIVFTNYLITRDEAQYCCAKYGMTLMAVDNAAEQSIFEGLFLPLVGTVGSFWLGVFSDNTTTDIYNVKKQPFTWTNWDDTELPPEHIGDNGTYMFNSSVCVKGDLSENFKWKLENCDEKLPYVCEVTVNDTSNFVDVGQHDVVCPHLVKFTSTGISRQGNILQSGTAYAGTYGHFLKEDKVTEMGTQIVTHMVTNYQDCIILCLNNAGCSEIILVSDQLCMLYQDA